MRTNNHTISPLVSNILNANRLSAAIPLKNIFMYSIAANITGTPTGTVKLQVSNDPETNDTMPSANPMPTPSNWVDLANSSIAVTAAGETLWSVNYCTYNWVRVSYTDSSSGASTATMSIVANLKGV